MAEQPIGTPAIVRTKFMGMPVKDYKPGVPTKDYEGVPTTGASFIADLGDDDKQALIKLHGGADGRNSKLIGKLYDAAQLARAGGRTFTPVPHKQLGLDYNFLHTGRRLPVYTLFIPSTGKINMQTLAKGRPYSTAGERYLAFKPDHLDGKNHEISHIMTAGVGRIPSSKFERKPGDTKISFEQALLSWFGKFGQNASGKHAVFPNMPAHDLASYLKYKTGSDHGLSLLSYYNDIAEYTGLAHSVKYALGEAGIYAPRLTLDGKANNQDVLTILLRNKLIRSNKNDGTYTINSDKLNEFQNKKLKNNPYGIDLREYQTDLQNFIDLINYRQTLRRKRNKTPEEIKALKHAERVLTNGYDMASNRIQRTTPVGGLRSWYDSTYPSTDTAIG